MTWEAADSGYHEYRRWRAEVDRIERLVGVLDQQTLEVVRRVARQASDADLYELQDRWAARADAIGRLEVLRAEVHERLAHTERRAGVLFAYAHHLGAYVRGERRSP